MNMFLWFFIQYYKRIKPVFYVLFAEEMDSPHDLL